VRTRPTVLFHAPDAHPVPDLVRQWAEDKDFPLLVLPDAAEVHAIVLRGFPAFLFVDADRNDGAGVALVRTLKSDPFTAIVPVVMLSGRHDPRAVESWFAAGTDEVVTSLFSPAEQRARMDAILNRTERDVSVHPSTRLPGTTEIERAIRRGLESGQEFAVCYADLDHFKEFNDRYSYYDGDRVIYILSRVLHDVVKGVLGLRGFVGHIGGDDFIFVIPLDEVNAVCTEIVSVFDTLVPLQYNEQDRRAGYFFGKDRRGQLHRVPLMTLSIGIVTNRSRNFTHPAQVSELATEMKSYAKTLPGSVFVVDRRQSGEPDDPGQRRPDAGRQGAP
jgi:GGDEF domain-containing protein